MKSTDKVILDGLRKTTLKYLSDEDYAQIISAVEKQGLLGLTGAAGRMVKTAVIKHGSHDQKTHGRGGKGGGGGGGGGGSSASSRPSSEKDKQGDQLADNLSEKTYDKAVKEADSLRQDAIDYSPKERKLMGEAQDSLVRAAKDFKDAKKLTGEKKLNKLQSGINKLEKGQGRLLSSEMKDANNLAESLEDLKQDNIDLINALELDIYNP